LKKQEEFELQQAMGQTEAWDKDSKETSVPGHRAQVSTSSVGSVKTPLVTAMKKKDDIPTSTLLGSPSFESTQEASYASLQRALNAAIAGREQFNQEVEEQFAPLPPHDTSPMNNSGVLLGNPGSQMPVSAFSDWGSSAASSVVWTPSQSSEDPYDFAGITMPNQSSQNQSPHDAHSEAVQQPTFNQSFANFSFAANPGSFHEPLDQSHTLQEQQSVYAPESTIMSQPLQPPFYPESRRGSCSEELANTLGNFGLNPASQATPVPTQPQESVFKRPDTQIDIAARRKRPRPAALGTAALRSRSYAGPPTMSPTARVTPTGPVPAMRRIKSTGQSLNVNYSGVRKASTVQRSPLNHATFAEAGAFNRVMTTQGPMDMPSPSTSARFAPPTPLSPNDAANNQTEGYGNDYYLGVDQDTPNQYAPSLMGIRTMASPPHTPLNPDMVTQMQNPWMQPPPMSAPPQYATFPDYTPPYSAGPLTSSSWSDAPLTSPEFHSFPPNIHMPQPTYVSPMIYGEPDIYHPGFRSSPSQGPSPHSLAGISPPSGPQKATEFCIQEFPQQKEAHAHAAKQLATSKPKNFIFANATSSDYQQDQV
jgi:hypothetical protein